MGTWIVDEAGFFDERIVYVIQNYCAGTKGINFIFPMLILNFRKDVFNRTSRLLTEVATDVFPLTAYCEHPDCIADSYYTYRYYTIDGVECPALYFDPLIIVGGDKTFQDPKIPNYSTRCDVHHYLPGKEYTFLTLKPLGELAYGGGTPADDHVKVGVVAASVAATVLATLVLRLAARRRPGRARGDASDPAAGTPGA